MPTPNRYDGAESAGLPDTNVGIFKQERYDEEAMKKGWTVISMKNDWKKIVTFEP